MHTTLSIDDDLKEDLQNCKKVLGVTMSHVMRQLYVAWREGKVSVSTLPDGTSFDGPLSKR